MQSYLIFRLHGAMCSWGDIAVGENRPSNSYPTRSAVLGLVAAALGIRRTDTQRMEELFRSVHYAVRIDKAGTLLTDYQTVQVPGSGRHERPYESRREELSVVSKHDLNTILSRREYLCDAMYTIALWLDRDNALITLGDIAESLRRPVFPLYLGRKSCPPALPLAPVLIEAATLRDLFSTPQLNDERTDTEATKAMSILLRLYSLPSQRQVYFESNEQAGMEAVHRLTRRDDPVSRTRWQFSARQELHGTIEYHVHTEE